MAKDYVKKGSVKERRNVPKQLIALLASFLCGYLTATIFDFTSFTSWVNSYLANNNKEITTEKKKIAKQPVIKPKFEFYTLLAKDNSPPITIANRPIVANAKSQQGAVSQITPGIATQGAIQGANNSTQIQATAKQKFVNNSLALLPSQASTLSHQGAPIADGKITASATTRAKEAFLIQIAAFNKRQDAENLKAALVLRGFDVAISPIYKNNINWFRVIVGPFPTRAEAEKAQVAMTRSEHMKGMIRKIDV
ncbi:SPOR domain-containing protein [Legionella sp. D16C41]|uniref:SPOR domain-containing protein n=1 Tax=Legionella sp. D16C41 TaxID=3402688 RepID=UPI003AF6EA72